MIIEIIVLLIALLSIALYFSVIKPFLIYRKYVQLLPQLGYKVYVHPFRPFGSHVRQMMVKDRQKYGDVVKSFKDLYPNFDLCVCNVLQEPVLEIVNPDLIKEFYQNNNQYNYVKADVITSAFKMLVKHGILMKQGNEWKQRKKIISSVFTHEFLINLMPEIHKICIHRFDEMEKKCKTGEKRFQVNLNLTFQEIFSQVIVRLFFGSEPSQTLDGKNICVFINEIMFDIVKQLKSPLFNIFGEAVASRNLKKKLKSFKQLARNLIDKRINQINKEKQQPVQPRDIVEALVLSGQFSYVQHKLTEDDERLTYDDLIGQFCTFFVAGMDTTSNFMTSLVYHLAKQSSAQTLQKLRQEIERVMNEKQGEHLSFKDIKKMNYIDMVQKQGLRMFSPVNGIFFRKAIKDHYLKDIPIPVGMTVVARNRPNFFKEEYFPEPFTFNPERWGEVNHNLHPYAYLPFSSGARTCLGNTLSMMESKVVLAELLHRYKTMKLQKEDYRMVIVFIYAPEKTMITLQKE